MEITANNFGIALIPGFIDPVSQTLLLLHKNNFLLKLLALAILLNYESSYN